MKTKTQNPFLSRLFIALSVLCLGLTGAMATDPSYPDASGAVTAAGSLFAAVGVIAAAALLWAIGSRLARKYIK